MALYSNMKTHLILFSPKALAIASALAIVCGCTTVPVTGRHELNLVSSDQEMQLGLSSFDQLKKETPVSHDPSYNALVQRVGQKVARVADKDLPGAKWEFVVFDSAEPNAFCLPGGKVGVYTAILPICLNDAGLATVLGHESGHAVAHHGASRMSEAMLTQAGGQALSATWSTADPKWQSVAALAYGIGSKVGVELPYSRAQESEADHIGLVYMARAGYDPKEAIAFWQRFMEWSNQHSGSSMPAFLRDHPVDSVRIKQLQEWLPEAEAEYAKSQKQ